MDSKNKLQVIKANLVGSTQRVSGKLAFQSLVWFVTIMSSAKESRTAELYLTLPNYYKTFHLL